MFYTVVDPDNGNETKINFYVLPNDTVILNGINISQQQLMELGTVFLYLAGNEKELDTDSCFELLNGYNCNNVGIVKLMKKILSSIS